MPKTQTDMVSEFFIKHGFSQNQEMGSEADVTADLLGTAAMLSTIAADQERRVGERFDLRTLSSHLILEEVAELLRGLADGDRVKSLDGLCDSEYIIRGIALRFGLPLDEGFAEVHRSNMTKDVRRPGDVRLRDKGAGYEAPRLDEVLRRHDAMEKTERRSTQEAVCLSTCCSAPVRYRDLGVTGDFTVAVCSGCMQTLFNWEIKGREGERPL